MNYKLVGKHYFDPSQSQRASERMDIWPGLITAIDQYEGGLLCLIDVKHKIIRTESVLDVLADTQNLAKRKGSDIKRELYKACVGTVVLTRYNNRLQF